MISIDQRILLVFISLALMALISIHNLIKYPSFAKRNIKFLQLLVVLFPILDLKLPPAEWNFKCFEVSILLFSLINLTSVLQLIKRTQKKWIYLFFGILIFLAISSEFYDYSLLAVIRLALVALLIVLMKNASENGLHIVKKILIPIVIWAIAFFLIQTFFGMEFTLYQSMNETSTRDLRYTSFAQDPQKFAQIAFMIAIIFIGDLYTSKKRSNVTYWTIIICCLLMGLSTGARAPLFGFAIGIIWLILTKISIRSLLFLLLITLVANFYIESIMNLQTFQRMDSVDQAFDGRLELFWYKGWMIFMDHFWIGVGPGNFLNYVTAHHSSFTYGPNGAIVDQPESGFLLWLCENGVVGFILYIYLILKVMIHSTKENNSKPYKLAIVVWIIGFITVFSLSDVKILFLLSLSIGMIFTEKPKLKVLN